MKPFGKNIFSELNINPIHRDLFLVTISGLLVALAVVTVAAMVIGQF